MHVTTDLQHACKGLKGQSTSVTMATINATASCLWHLLQQCHYNRVMPPHFLAFAQTKKCVVLPADCSGGVLSRQFD